MIKSVIDLGSNSIKLLLAEITGRQLKPLLFTLALTRLGEKLGPDGKVYPPALERTLAGLEEMVTQARRLKAEEIILLGTQAVRESREPDLKTLIREKLGLELTVLSPQDEARLTRRGALAAFSDSSAAILDIGGKSTELAGEDFSFSLPLGAVNLSETFFTSDPVTEAQLEAMRQKIESALWEILPPRSPRNLVGVGGTIVTLAQMVKNQAEIHPFRLHGSVLTREEIAGLNAEVARLTVEQRREYYRIPLLRADIILAGGILAQMMMEFLNMDKLSVSIAGLTLGALLAPGMSVQFPLKTDSWLI